MSEILSKIATCVERGKINQASPYPADLKGELGADELTQQALQEGHPASDIVSQGLIVGMRNIGDKFRMNKVFLPEVLMAAKAMMKAMDHIRPFYESGQVKHKGVFVIGTVAGDLHEIGKNMVAMIVRGAGWNVVDLGYDVPHGKFLETIRQYQAQAVGLSALLTTTMENMAQAVATIKNEFPNIKVIVGGAPITQKFADSIRADGYSPDPQGTVDFLERVLVEKI